MKINLKEKLNLSNILFFLLMALFVFALFKRYIFGLGAISNLKDDMPWGLWKGLNLFGGVALASGGFVITAVVYIFNLKEFRIFVRPLILTSFLGYLMVILALLIDDGKPWNIFMPLFLWNTRSVMWEVAMCVAFYTTVLFLEFLPLVWEKIGFKKTLKLWQWLTPLLVVIGVLLSTLHQSSLGTLLVIVPQKLHPFWYSPILPLLFFLSAVALGLSTVTILSFLFSKYLPKSNLIKISKSVSIANSLVLFCYLFTRVLDLYFRKVLFSFLSTDFASLLFFAEILLLFLIPVTIFVFKKSEIKSKLLFAANLSVVLGVILNRMDTSIVAFQIKNGAFYFPAFLEIVVSISIFAIAIFLFNLTIKNLPVFSVEQTNRNN